MDVYYFFLKHIDIIKNKIKNIELNFKKNIFNKINIEKENFEYIKLKSIIDEFNELKNIYNSILFCKKEIESNSYIKELACEELNIFLNLKNKIENNLKKIITLEYSEKKNKGCFLEIKSGTGGNESSLFVINLFKMYQKYFNRNLWKFDILNKVENENGGIKEIFIKINNNLSYDKLKFESGGHRVQRIPKTESQEKIHTSTCIVAVTPIDSDVDNFSLNISDLRIDTFKSSGAGGQHVNTTNSAVRVIHLPTGINVECQDERSQHKNKSKALNILKEKIISFNLKKKKDNESILKKKLFGSGYRNDRIRTYNYINNMIIDHRISLRLNKLEEILNSGNLDIIINFIEDKYISNKFEMFLKNVNL
ncbi:peptide chain release factor 1 [endosymbiont of Sipalinus gigas]|uniref:PCRF domain-containing protein n=1 Tax=endosymbiont of Sipalinus gigas TaxID=1972134 RepID=UPI000DC7326B|nr:PCRF domain-containing protein [endosymbiont of Sipalinus gigas]BBA85206.1 peptide chain release factor 1 [endosymbiont of Sipalinus gigas]